MADRLVGLATGWSCTNSRSRNQRGRFGSERRVSLISFCVASLLWPLGAWRILDVEPKVVVGKQVEEGGRELEVARSQHRHRLALAWFGFGLRSRVTGTGYGLRVTGTGYGYGLRLRYGRGLGMRLGSCTLACVPRGLLDDEEACRPAGVLCAEVAGALAAHKAVSAIEQVRQRQARRRAAREQREREGVGLTVEGGDMGDFGGGSLEPPRRWLGCPVAGPHSGSAEPP